MSCASVTIDAGVLVVPGRGVARDDAYRYVETLLDWLKLLNEPWIVICMSERSAESLVVDDLYPLRNQLQRLFTQHGIVEYDVNTVSIVIDRLLTRTPSFETYFRVREILAEDISTTPDILQLSSGSDLQSDLARCVVLIAILRAHCGDDILNHALILRISPTRLINVRALVHDIEHARDDFGRPVPTPPEYFEGDVLTCDDFRSLLDCIDESAVLKNAIDDAGVEIAIRIALYKSRFARSLDTDWDDVSGVRMGTQFGAAIRNCCRGAPSSVASSVLRAAAETIDKQNLAAVHALRTGPSGNNPRRRRTIDDAKACRRDIDREYHLHYWELPEGDIEFASVGPHNDFSIPD